MNRSRYYRKAKASPERKAIEKAFQMGISSMNVPLAFVAFVGLFIGFYIGYILSIDNLLNS